VFGGGIRGRVRSGRISRDRAIVDDPATLRGLRLHYAERSAGAKKRAQEVGRDDRPELCRAELIQRNRGHVDSGIVEQECEVTVPFDHGIKELFDRSVVGDIGDTRLNQSRALSELPGPLKRLHFSTGNHDGPASAAQRKPDSLADTAAASGDYRGPHVPVEYHTQSPGSMLFDPPCVVHQLRIIGTKKV
jgi:hypothetical protein